MYTCTGLGIGPERRKIFEDFHRIGDSTDEKFVLEVPEGKDFVQAFSNYLKLFACKDIAIVLELLDGSLMLFHVRRKGARGSCEVYKYGSADMKIPWSDAALRFRDHIAEIPNITLYREVEKNKWKMTI